LVVSPFGYGRGLYICHNDGKYSVYGHLQKFSDKIEKIVRKEHPGRIIEKDTGLPAESR